MDTCTEQRCVRRLLIGVALVFFGIFLALPLACVFYNAFSKGLVFYLATLRHPDALAAMRMTMITALVAVPLNLVFGVAASWAIVKFDFKGKNLLVSFIDLPLSVSPVISGLIFVLIFGAQGVLGPWLLAHDIQILFAPPAIILATIFVTFPMVAR
jgi:sulfate/thiosulfate transport system permease protein